MLGEGTKVIVRVIVAIIGTVAIFAHLLGRMNAQDATYFLCVATFLLVMEHVLNGDGHG